MARTVPAAAMRRRISRPQFNAPTVSRYGYPLDPNLFGGRDLMILYTSHQGCAVRFGAPGVDRVEQYVLPAVVGEDHEDRLQRVSDVVEVPPRVVPLEALGLALGLALDPVLFRAVDVEDVLSVRLSGGWIGAESERSPPHLSRRFARRNTRRGLREYIQLVLRAVVRLTTHRFSRAMHIQASCT